MFALAKAELDSEGGEGNSTLPCSVTSLLALCLVSAHFIPSNLL